MKPVFFGLLLATNLINLQRQAMQPVTNSAVFLTKDTFSSGACDYVKAQATGGTAYAYDFGPVCKTLVSLPAGMHFVATFNVTNVQGGFSLTLGGNDTPTGHSVKIDDGITDPAPGFIVVGRPYWLFFDGQVYRLGW